MPSTLDWKKSKKDTICKFVYIFSLLRQMFWTVLIIYLEDKMWKVLHKLNWSNISHSLTSQLPENGSVFLSQPHSAQSWSWAQSCEHGQLFYFPHRSRQWENSLSASVTKENKNTQLIDIYITEYQSLNQEKLLVQNIFSAISCHVNFASTSRVSVLLLFALTQSSAVSDY